MLIGAISDTHDNLPMVVYGHTHQAKGYVSGETLIVNPGEVCGYLTGESTIATVDTDTRQIETLRL